VKLQPHHAATSETRRRIDDLNQRITRQQRRIERILVHREGPADEMQAVLEDMIKARDVMQAQLERSEPEPSAVAAM
jgi:hypothetical protein